MAEVLVIEDEDSEREVLKASLESMGHRVVMASSGAAGLRRCRLMQPDVVLLDLRLPDADGLDVLVQLKETCPETEVVVLTADSSVDTAVLATKRGAYDFLVKPAGRQRLGVLIEKAEEKGRILREVSAMRSQLAWSGSGGKLIGTSAAMQDIYKSILIVAAADSTCLVTGESGTGKEMVVRAIHYNSPRRSRPLVPLNCAAIPESMLESELFGYNKGAFTGAVSDKAGLFEEAHGGTLFLDEITELHLNLQAKLLRVLQEKEVRRVGATRTVTVDCRVIASTNVDLLKEVKEHRFREDLYYRLNVLRIHVPPLRERREDIPLLISAFLEEFTARYGKGVKTVAEPTMKILTEHDWPGNVRELKNVMERAVLLSEGSSLQPSHLPVELMKGQSDRSMTTFSFPVGTTLERAEEYLIIQALKQAEGNKVRAAECLGISLRTLYNKLARYQL